MSRFTLPSLLFAAALALPASSPLVAQPPAPLTAKDRAAIVDDLLAALNKTYVFPDTAQKMEQHVRRQQQSGAYESLSDLEAFTHKLTEDLRSVSKDRHLTVRSAPPGPPPGAGQGPTPEQLERQRLEIRRDNACFKKVELLAGNVGYVKLNCFVPAQLGGATAVAAMGFLAGSEALIFDLRENGGGSPSMIQLLTSYLLDDDDTTHLNSFYIREGEKTEQYWTQAWVPGTKLPEVPVYVLTSNFTFSAAEEFTYNLKNLKRATIVGETTGGGAHPVNMHRVEGYPVMMSLPFGRAVNPITGTNWEGTGVAPDVAVPAAEALFAAHRHALGKLAEKATDPEDKNALLFALTMLEAKSQTISLSAEQMAAFVGNYGPRRLFIEQGGLWYQRGAGAKRPLTALSGDRFLVGGVDDFLLRFERDRGKVARLVGVYADGNEEANPRDP